MTTVEKIELLKDSITYFYEKEGRSAVYISQALCLNRKELGLKIHEWGLVKADMKHLNPSTQKFVNNHKKEIIDMMDSDVDLREIARRLNIGTDRLIKTIIPADKELTHHHNLEAHRREVASHERIQGLKDKSRYTYDPEDLSGEEWKPILGYSKYMVSNMGRVKSYSERYKSYHLMLPNKNNWNGRYYIALVSDKGVTKTYSLPRLVAHAFVDGYSETNNTVDHLNGDVTDNRAENLEWVSQGTNNKRKYDAGFAGRHKGYSRNGNFKSIKMDGKYEFKTIRALAKFLGVSEAQAGRYISGESKTTHRFDFTY